MIGCSYWPVSGCSLDLGTTCKTQAGSRTRGTPRKVTSFWRSLWRQWDRRWRWGHTTGLFYLLMSTHNLQSTNNKINGLSFAIILLLSHFFKYYNYISLRFQNHFFFFYWKPICFKIKFLESFDSNWSMTTLCLYGLVWDLKKGFPNSNLLKSRFCVRMV